MNAIDANKIISNIKKQFLCQTPLNKINLSDQIYILQHPDSQLALLQNTLRLEAVKKYPISIDYQQRFLKSLIQQLENNNSEVEETLYEEYAKLLTTARQKQQSFFYKHYWIEEADANIVLKEDSNLISEGTTGLHTWEAGLALSEWILSKKDVFSQKACIELGSGVGLAGLVLSLLCSPKTFYFTDCHSSVLSKLLENIKINQLDESEAIVRVLDLPWENCDEETCKNIGKIDYIIAADVVFDASIFHALHDAILAIFLHCGAVELFLCCKERNSETLTRFLALLDAKFRVSEYQLPENRHFLWDRQGVRLFGVTPLG